jgi:hypothetical protein
MLRPVRLPKTLTVVVVAALFGASARAEPVDAPAAEQLFEAGRAAMERQDYATACQRFRESQQLDPAAGTLINLAECLDRQGLVASSWQAWKEARDTLRTGDERIGVVDKKLTAAAARLPKLELRLAEGAPDGTVVTRDGLALGPASLSLALPVDPGPHKIIVTAPGHAPHEYDVTIAEAATQTLTVEAGAAEQSAPVATKPPEAGPAASAPPANAPPPAPVAEGGGSRRTWGWVSLSVGGAGLVVAGTTGLLALGKKHTMDSECTKSGSALLCSDAGVDAAHSGKTFATVADVSAVVAVIGGGVGAYLLLSSGDSGKTAVSASAAPGGAGLSLSRTF